MNSHSVTSIFGDLDVEVELDAPIGVQSWFTAGGTADTLVRPASIEALAEIIRRCRRTTIPVRIMGEGANLLVSDEGVGGIVIRLDAPAFKSVEFNSEGGLELMKVGAGADMARTLMDATRRGLAGLSQMAGIPASIGGAIRMNAGGSYGAIGDAVHAVACLSKSGDINVYPAEQLRFDYRSTNITDPIILWATFQVTPSDPVALRQRVKEIFTYKKSTQPLADKSAGCMFKNPVPEGKTERVSAGAIIDQAGLKGHRVGTAEVSDRHANFITIDRGGKADDAIALAHEIARIVLEKTGVRLDREVAVWTRDDDTGSI